MRKKHHKWYKKSVTEADRESGLQVNMKKLSNGMRRVSKILAYILTKNY
jgi:hypothetical protein